MSDSGGVVRQCKDCTAAVVGRSLRCDACKRRVAVDAATAWRKRNVERRKEYERQYYARNPARQAAATAAWRERNPEKVAAYKASITPEQRRNWTLKSRFGITLVDQRRMLLEQGGKCAICAEPLTDETLAVDPHHETGEVRGLLCRACNSSLGQFERDPERLLRAFEYLTESRRLRLLQEEETQ